MGGGIAWQEHARGTRVTLPPRGRPDGGGQQGLSSSVQAVTLAGTAARQYERWWSQGTPALGGGQAPALLLLLPPAPLAPAAASTAAEVLPGPVGAPILVRCGQ